MNCLEGAKFFVNQNPRVMSWTFQYQEDIMSQLPTAKFLEFNFVTNKQFSILPSEFKSKDKHLYGVFLSLETILQFPFPLA